MPCIGHNGIGPEFPRDHRISLCAEDQKAFIKGEVFEMKMGLELPRSHRGATVPRSEELPRTYCTEEYNTPSLGPRNGLCPGLNWGMK